MPAPTAKFRMSGTNSRCNDAEKGAPTLALAVKAECTPQNFLINARALTRLNNMAFLILHHGALGDFVLTWPALRCLRLQFPDQQFFGIGRPEYMRLAVRQGLIDAFRDIETAAMLDFLSGKALPPDMPQISGAVLWHSRAEPLTRLLQASATLSVIAVRPFPDVCVHVAHYYCEILHREFSCNMPHTLSDGFPPRIQPTRTYALIHPGSGSRAKNYAPSVYRAFAEKLRQHGYDDIRVVLGPVELERGAAQEFRGERIEAPANVEQLADLLESASLYIGNDSGASHLAAILGIPTLALYKTTNPAVWGVIGQQAVSAQAQDEQTALAIVEQWLECCQQDAGDPIRAA